MTKVSFWTVADLVTQTATPSGFKVSLEDIVPGVGTLVSGPLSQYSADGTPFERGYVLFGKLRPYLAKYWLADRKGVAGGDIHVYRPQEGVDPRYLAYIVGSRDFVRYAVAASKGVKMPRVEWMSLRQYAVNMYDKRTQGAIADYLDRETGEIDAMLAKLDELTETLRLRRVQVIQSAVRSSRSVGIGLMLDVKLGKMLQTKSKSPTDRLQPYLRAAHIQPGGRLDLEIDTKEMYFSERESETLSLRAGDAVIVEGGSIGRAAYLTEDMPGWGFQNSIIRLRGASADTRYAVYALQAALESGEIAMVCNSATFAHFTVEKVESFRIPFHGRDKHERIAEHLDEVTGNIDVMLTKVAELKALLVERRAALISDVVTGRKKVA